MNTHRVAPGEQEQLSQPSSSSESDAALAAFEALLLPLARLAVHQGVTVGLLEELLRRAMVQVATDNLLASGFPPHRLVSRVSTTTGLTRREVMRISEALGQGIEAVDGSLAADVFTRWSSDKSLRDAEGRVRALPRHGDGQSFEALARSVTRDVHPRTLLDELCRLGMAHWDEESDTVELLKEAFVPDGDKQQMLRFLAGNVGDHLSGAVDNVMGQKAGSHVDQAVFADELSAESLPLVREFVAQRWKSLLAEAVPMLEQRIAQDAEAHRVQNKRVRIGLYSYEDDMPVKKK